MLAPVAERQAALARRFPRWTPRALHEMLDAAAREFPDRPYVVTDGAEWTYREVRERSLRVAWGLAAAGVRPGEHVALVMANFPEFVPVKFGISRAGAVCVPINFLNRRDELGYVLRQSDAVLLITMDRFRDLDYLGMLDELAPGWEGGGGGDRLPLLRRVVVFPTGAGDHRAAAATLEQLMAGAGPVPAPAVDPASVSDILYTSGTTGQPKGVLLTHDMLLRTAYGSAYARAFEDARRLTFALPMYHVFGYVEGMLAALFVGGAIIPQTAFSGPATLRAIASHRATDALWVPTMTLAVLDELERDRSHDLSSLRSVISSGGVAPTRIWERIDALLGPVELTHGYGMTETTASTTVTPPDDPRERLSQSNGRLRDAGVAGDPALGGRLVVYRVVDPADGRELQPGAGGELRARGPGVTSGYYKKPAETEAAFDEEGWFRTGDIGRIDERGYLTLAGRLKESYRCGGEQVMPREVEDVLTGHPDVAQAHVVALPDERMGEVGVAFIVPRPGAGVDSEELLAYTSERLARFKVPRHVLAIDPAEIPVTPSGRPRKFLLSEMAAARLRAQP